MANIGIIGAMEEEIAFLREQIEIITTKSLLGLTYHIGRFSGHQVVLVRSGIGKVHQHWCRWRTFS